MKKLVCSALALSMTSAAALASESEDWAQLDEDVQALSASLSGLESSGMKFGGRIRAIYANSGDIMVGANDLGGFEVLNTRLKATGNRGDYGYVFQAEFAGGVRLLDAFINIPVGSNMTVRTGQFKGIILRESLISSGKIFFIDRSQAGNLFSGRREGIALMGNFDAFDWAITIQDGSDGDGDELFYALRGEIDFLGEGTDMVEGAYGAGDEVEGSAAVSYWDDGQLDDADGLAFEGSIATNLYSFQANILDLGDNLYTGNGSGGFLQGDATPFSIQGTVMVTQPTENRGGWELGARFQDLDDTNDTNIIDLGANYYLCGHNLKYIINWTTVDSDTADFDIIQVGMQVGF